MHDVCQDDTGRVSSRYGSVEHWHRSGGAMMHGVSCAQMHGCVKADNNDTWVRMSGCVNSMGRVTDVGGGLSGCGNAWRWRNLDVSSARCNSGTKHDGGITVYKAGSGEFVCHIGGLQKSHPFEGGVLMQGTRCKEAMNNLLAM